MRQLQVPVARGRQAEDDLCRRETVARDRDTPAVGIEELARLAEHVPKRVLRILHASQMAGEAVEEPERVELAVGRDHGQAIL